MARALVKLTYRQVIDASSTGNIERSIFGATYDEFLLKSQTYNMEGKFKTFAQLKANDGRANSLHYKIAFGAGHFVEMCKNRIPELTDNTGNSVAFDVFKFELIESDINNIDVHKVAVNYITETLTLLNTIGEYLLFAKGEIKENEPIETFIIKMQPNLSILEYQAINYPMADNQLPMHINNN
jgi:hypothetical protein